MSTYFDSERVEVKVKCYRVKCLLLGGYRRFMFIYNQKFFQMKNVPNIRKNMVTFSENVMLTS